MKRFSLMLFFLSVVMAMPVLASWEMKQGPLMTRWASEIDVNNPLPEYPRPQMVRDKWLNLNGIWQFQPGSSSDPIPVGQTLTDEILVPFPMESAISGIMAHHERSWYRRTFEVPSDWAGKNILLHLDAVDWESQVYVNGNSVAIHKGGYDPVVLDITPYLNASGSQELIVRVFDPTDDAGYPRGKQTLYPGGIMYTAVSGIWQPVWIEPVDPYAVSDLRMTPDIDNSRLKLRVNTLSVTGNMKFNAVVRSQGQTVASLSDAAPNTDLEIVIPNQRLWSPNDPFLYDLEITLLRNSVVIDTINSYFGMRKCSLGIVDGVHKMFLNNEFVFQMGPLDQGWWPDGLYRAPTDEALKYDIEKTKEFGFNMTRKHIKVESARWYYWADKIGLMVWQDMPSVNSYTGNPQPIDKPQFELELNRMIDTCWNSPSIVSWVVFNEWQGQHDTEYLVNMVKTKDPSRLVNQGSGGGYANVGDIYDVHSYPQPGFPNPADESSAIMARVCGEYGGIGYIVEGHLWNPNRATGIYSSTNNPLELLNRYNSYHDSLLSFKVDQGLSAAVYTEITDVENECNGLMTYDRIVKVSEKAIAKANHRVIVGDLSSEVVLPTSQTNARTWTYTTDQPADGWFETGFDTSAWLTGNGGFGTSGTPNAVIGTNWNTSDIWLRQSFVLGDYTPSQINLMSFNIFHDEDVEVYINGVLAGTRSGYTTSYISMPINDAGKAALISGGENVIAIHCHQAQGGQFIDAGISIVKQIVNASYVPVDTFSYWNMDESAGNIATDISGDNNGTVYNGAAWNAAGRVNGCIDFDGIDDHVRVARQISNDFSVAFWTKTTQVAGGNDQWWQGCGIIDADIPFQADDFGISLFVDKLAFGVGNQDKTIVSESVINDGMWHFCVVSRKADGTIKLYVDGMLEAYDVANDDPLASSATITFGAMNTDERYFDGSLDEVMFFDRELGDLEIAAMYSNLEYVAAVPEGVYAFTGNNSITVAWDDSPVASSYNVKRATVSGGPYTSVYTTNQTYYVDTDLEDDTEYYYVISAVNPVGESDISAEVSAKNITLMAWFNAHDIEGKSSGTAIDRWNDISGNGFDATQPDSGRRPVYIAEAVNGHPALRFTNSSKTYLGLARPVADNFTIMVVFRSTQGIGSGTQFYQGAGLINGEMPGVTNDYGTCLNADGKIVAGTGSPDRNVVSASGYNDGEPHLMTFRRVRSSGELKLFVDGVLVDTNTAGTQSLGSPSRLIIGAQQTEINYFSGDIAEIRIYNKALDDNKLNQAHTELINRYILGLPAPAFSPYPADDSVMVSAQTDLSWTPGAAAQLHRVYLGQSNPPAFEAEITEPSFDPAILEPQATYYWRVDEVNSAGTTVGQLWSFSTAIKGDLEPDGDVDLLDFASLAYSWQAASCGPANDWCQGNDIDSSGSVDLADLQAVSVNWLIGTDLQPVE